MAFDFTCRTRFQANRRLGPLGIAGRCFGDDLPFALRICEHVGRLHQQTATDAPVVPTWFAARPAAPVSSNRTLAFHLGFVVRISMAAGSKPGATMASTNCPGSASTSAVAASTGRLKPNTEPKALTGSPAKACRVASANVSATAAPQGLLCLITATAGSLSPRTMARAYRDRAGCYRRAPCR